MSFMFRPAVRESVGLVIGLAGPSGGGKTFSAMRLAKGLTPAGKRFAVIDTEAGRAKHYADQFAFDHGDLQPPFRPSAYADAILAADKAGYPVIVVDSFSHEHAGEGGLLDWQEEELTRMAGQDWQKREACKMAAWVKPKMAHKAMVQRLLQIRAHLIICFRAEQKVEMVRNDKGRMEIQPKKIASGFSDWIPICEKNILYELTASFLLTPDKPGLPQPIKLQEQHRGFFPLTEPIGEKAGQALAAWAHGGAKPAAAPAPASVPTPAPAVEAPKPAVEPQPAPEQPQLTAPVADTDDGRAFLEEPSPIDGGARDEATTGGLVAACEAEMKKWKRQPPAAMLPAIYAGFLSGKTDPRQADAGELQVMLEFFKGYTAGDKDAVAKVNGFARNARATA